MLVKNGSLVITILCILALAAAGAAATAPPDNPAGQEYTINQTLSDKAQESTIAFSGLAFLTGDACCDSFLPPGKVADYAGFQYLRDNDATGMGHNTDFVTRASDNVLVILNDAQRAQFIALAAQEAPLTERYGYMRFPLMNAFRRQLSGTFPSGSTGIDQSAMMEYSAALYGVDGQISIARAKTYASVIRSLNQTQREYLDRMASDGMLMWPIADASAILKASGQGNSVALRTYASEMFSWYAGSVEADTYFCPERQAMYFGSFYMKDRPAMGNPGYSIPTNLTGDSGQAFLAILDDLQREQITGLVDIQRADLNEIVATRRAIATELRRPLDGATIDEPRVLTLSARYGELDGRISYEYATHYTQVGKTVTPAQKQEMVALRNLNGFICEGAYLYSQPIQMPQNIPVNFLFGVGTYDSAAISAWIQGLQNGSPNPSDTTPPRSVTNLVPATIQPTFIKWSWVDPADSDLDKVMIYLNGKFKTNVSLGTQSYNATGLAANTQYILATKTIDTSGNRNKTWVNSTSRTTMPAPVITTIFPSSGRAGTNVSITNLAGNNFRSGAMVILKKTGQPDVPATFVVVSSPRKITCKFPIPVTAAPGMWDILVTNTDGTSGTKGSGFRIIA